MQLNIESKKIKYNKIDKEKNAKNKRIDPVDAVINAHITQMKIKTEEPTDYNKEMEDYLEKMGWN